MRHRTARLVTACRHEHDEGYGQGDGKSLWKGHNHHRTVFPTSQLGIEQPTALILDAVRFRVPPGGKTAGVEFLMQSSRAGADTENWRIRSERGAEISVELLAFRRAVREARGGGSMIRAALHQAIADHLLVLGDVLDLGGGEKASYRSRLQGAPARIVSIDKGARMDATFALDLEEVPLPFEEASYDTILAFNLLEHVYHYRELLGEMHRLLRPGGQVAVFVPFLIGYHPDPRDHFRYTDETLVRLLSEVGFTGIRVRGYGGRLSASANLALAVIPSRILRVPVVAFALTLDELYYRFARTATPRGAPLGYLATARR
jgi:SAM-dependent methyltransferase